MSLLTVPSTFEELVDYLAQKTTPSEILDFKVSETTQNRAEELLEKNSNDQLSLEEKLELEQMLYFDRLVSLLKAKALRQINPTGRAAAVQDNSLPVLP